MTKIVLATLLSLTLAGSCLAQDAAPAPKKEKEFDHYIGVQINELTKQILGVNNANSTLTNPYIFTYNLTERASGLGLRLGTGFDFITQTLDGGGKMESKSFDIRIGFEKVFKLSDKWSSGVGIDLLYKAKDTSINQSGSYGYDVSFKSRKMGLGPMGWLRVNLSKRILIGTEISLYYLTGHEKSTGSYYGNDIDNKVSEFKLNLPVAFFLSLKL